MELDTASSIAVISAETKARLFPSATLLPSKRHFSSFTKTKFKTLGYIQVNATFKGRTRFLDLYIVNFAADSLFGREWIAYFSDLISLKDFEPLNQIKPSSESLLTPVLQARLNKLCDKFPPLFAETVGKLKGPETDWHLKDTAKPKFAHPRNIPYSLKTRYKQIIDDKLKTNLYKKVSHSEWASPTHVVIKGDKVRITGDYKSTLNPQLIIDEHPIPKVDELFNKIGKSKIFCRLDIRDAFMHLPCTEKSCELMTLNTPTHGLIRPLRAQYGISSVPAVWQRRLEELLLNCKGAVSFFDDILLFANSIDEMFEILEDVFRKLTDAGLVLGLPKCEFFLKCIEFLGHKIDEEGLHKLDKHVEAVLKAPLPSSPDELKSFIGKVTYYHAFIPNLSSVTFPLREILKNCHGKELAWTKDSLEAFQNLKKELTSDRVLMPYNPELALVLAVDASPTGLGAVLSHRLPDNQERPIAYASKSLSTTERAYPQNDREALATVWGVKKFFQYVYGRHFILCTDNKAVSHIFAPDALLPKFTLSRCSNYASYLSNFDYEIELKNSDANANADYLSRINHPVDTVYSVQDDFDCFVEDQILQLPTTAKEIAVETQKDPHLSSIKTAIEAGENLSTLGFKGNEADFSLVAGCLMFGHRVVVPLSLRDRFLKELHLGHIGITKMKGIARSLVYWKNIDKDIEQTAKNCAKCLSNAKMPPKSNLHHWEYPDSPWSRIHVDYAGPVHGKFLLLVVDAYSKWTQVSVTNSMMAEETSKQLSSLFALYGVPDTVVSDNGRQFKSDLFNRFLKSQGVRFHKFSAPYHPSTNGQVERYVQTIKQAILNLKTTASNLQFMINCFLQRYHRAPHPTTGEPPSKLFLGRTINTRIDLVKPPSTKVAPERISLSSNIHSPSRKCILKSPQPMLRSFQVGDTVMFRMYNDSKNPWRIGLIEAKFGLLHYSIRYNGQIHKRHIDQIRSSGKKVQFKVSEESDESHSDLHYSYKANYRRSKSSVPTTTTPSVQTTKISVPTTTTPSVLSTKISVPTTITSIDTPSISNLPPKKCTAQKSSQCTSDSSPEYLGFYTPEETQPKTPAVATPVSSKPRRGRGRGFREPKAQSELRRSSRPAMPTKRFSPP